MHELTGQTFGKWTAIERVSGTKNGGGWLCRCECGTERIVRTDKLTGGLSKSCGCAYWPHGTKRYATVTKERLTQTIKENDRYKKQNERYEKALKEILKEAAFPRLDQFKPEDYINWFAEVARIALAGDTDE